MVYFFSFILVVGVIILVHEFGHFIAARAVGIRVDRFSIGFGPKIVSIQRGETDYRISWVPLGGYVKMAGMIDESMENPEDAGFDPADPRLFMNKTGPQKLLVVSAGVIMNMVLAALVLWGVYATRGVPSLPDKVGTVIDHPIAGFPAAKAGLLRGDRIVAIDGSPVETWPDLLKAISSRPGESIRVEIERGSEHMALDLATRAEGQRGKKIGKIGITPMLQYEKMGVGRAFLYGIEGTKTILFRTAQSIWLLISGHASVKDLAGPVGIAKMTGESARQGFSELLELLALISVNIGFLNILPIPALDGGHLVLVLIEGVRRRPLSTKLKLWIQQVGMILLLLLMAVVVFGDVMRLR
jgi:regulator of sigma E protease